jgi:hypothetical protein
MLMSARAESAALYLLYLAQKHLLYLVQKYKY